MILNNDNKKKEILIFCQIHFKKKMMFYCRSENLGIDICCNWLQKDVLLVTSIIKKIMKYEKNKNIKMMPFGSQEDKAKIKNFTDALECLIL
jgi:hypothetical protein